MQSSTSYCAVCLSDPFSPFPVKSCKKFKADEVYCWRKKLFLGKKLKKPFYSALLLKKVYSTINLLLEKAGKIPSACTILCLLFLEWLFVNLILIEKISTLSYEQEKNFIISESRIQMVLENTRSTSHSFARRPKLLIRIVKCCTEYKHLYTLQTLKNNPQAHCVIVPKIYLQSITKITNGSV